MSLYRTTLLVLPSAQLCVETILSLHRDFKAVHKRNAAAVDLFYSLCFSTDPERLNEADAHLITLQTDTADPKASEEVLWFQSAAQTLVSATV